jgi:hypothetical protein
MAMTDEDKAIVAGARKYCGKGTLTFVDKDGNEGCPIPVESITFEQIPQPSSCLKSISEGERDMTTVTFTECTHSDYKLVHLTATIELQYTEGASPVQVRDLLFSALEHCRQENMLDDPEDLEVSCNWVSIDGVVRTTTTAPEAAPDPVGDLIAEHGYWGVLEDFPVEDWQYEVANGDTRESYWGWVVNRPPTEEEEEEEGEDV